MESPFSNAMRNWRQASVPKKGVLSTDVQKIEEEFHGLSL